MRNLKTIFACLLMALFSIGQLWATEELKATLDFTDSGWGIPTSGTNKSEASFTRDGITIKLTATTNYKQNSGYLILGKANSTLELPAFTWTTTRIEVDGHSGASGSVVQNIYVGGNAVSTATTGANGVTNSYDIASAYQAAGNVYVFTVTSAHNTQIDKIRIYGEGGGSTKTLSSVAVSGAPTKTSYHEGDNFDPAGLTVTGTYSDESTAPITSGITWSYNPSQTLALNQTSIGVTATVSSIASPEFTVNGLSVTEAPAADNYELVTDVADLADAAEIIIVNLDENQALSTTQNTNNRAGTAVSSVSSIITPGDAVQIITLEASSSNWMFNVGDSKYLYASSNSSNQLKSAATSTAGDNGVWSIAIASDGAATVRAQGTNSRKELHYNPNSGSPIFNCYAENSTTGTLVKIFKKVEGTVKPSAELAYATSSVEKLVGAEAFTNALTNPHTVTVSYASDNTEVATVDPSTGEVSIVAAGKAVITASFAGNDDYKAGSASYTICVTTHAGTELDPYSVADAKIVIDAVSTKENAYVSGIVSSIYSTSLGEGGFITFYISADGATSGQQLEAYKCKSLNGEAFDALSDVETGANVVITGTLKKYNSTYEFDQNCHLVSYEAPAIPKTHIANDQANPYTVAQAITYAADGVTYDLDDYVYVQGVVYDVKNFSTGAMNIFIKDAGESNQFELYKCAGINDGSSTTPFEALTDVQAGNIVIGYGQLTVFNTTYEFKQGNYLVDLQKPVTGVELDATAEVEVGQNVNLTATILPSNATGTIVWTVESGDAYASVDAGVVTGIEAGEAVIRATVQGTTFYAECTVTVNGASPVLTDYYEKVTSGTVAEGTYLIVYEEGSLAFNGGLATLDAESNTIAVDITSDNKIGVTSATEAATFYIDPAAGTVKSASGNFIGVGSWSNGLKQDKEYAHNVLEIDGDGNAQIGIYNADWNTTGGTMRLQYNKSAGQTRFRYYKNGGQQSIALYKLANEVIKPAAGLAWDPADDIEITVGEAFTPRTLQNPNGIDAAEITIESSNTDLATVTAGEVALVADATGTTTITATFAGNDDYKAATISYKIKVNPASSIYVSPSLNVNFSSVVKDAALPTDQKITVTLNNVAAATATLGGTNPDAFSVDKTALTESGDITISVVSSATVGEFKATLTISDDASAAASKEVKLSFTVTDPASEETPISTSTKWVAAVAADLVDGAEVLITGVKDEVTYAMGEQKSTNRAAYVATIDGEGVLTPGEGTMAFTLVAQEGGTFALRTSNGKYLYAAASGNNHLKTQDEVDVNAKWTLTIASAVAEGSSNRNVMQFNGGSSKLFSCYGSASQQPIAFYVPQTTPTPVEIRTGLTPGNYYTICYPKAITSITGATLWSFVGKDADFAYIQQESAPFVAGRPYIIQATASTVQAVFEGDAETDPGSNNGLYGTFTNLEQSNFEAAGSHIYIVVGNELRLVNGGTGNHLPAYRAYVNLDEITGGKPNPAPGKNVRSMPMHKDAATGIDNAEASEAPRKVMIDGTLFILRGEQMFDATGRLVK